jgi:hypothetical protein
MEHIGPLERESGGQVNSLVFHSKGTGRPNVDLEPGIISRVTTANSSMIVFYSTIPVFDSDDQQGPLVALNPPMNTSVASIQVFQCSLSLVDQVASIDSQTQQIHTVEPDVRKTTSKWMPSPDVAESDLSDGYQNVTNSNNLINSVGVQPFTSTYTHSRFPVDNVVQLHPHQSFFPR